MKMGGSNGFGVRFTAGLGQRQCVDAQQIFETMTTNLQSEHFRHAIFFLLSTTNHNTPPVVPLKPSPDQGLTHMARRSSSAV